MSIPLYKKLQFSGALLMLCGLLYAGWPQELMLLLGSLALMASMLIRMYLVHSVYKIPMRFSVLNYIFVPMLAFLGAAYSLGYQPDGISFGMWFYLQVWMGGVLGVSMFFFVVSRRLLALPWRNQGHK